MKFTDWSKLTKYVLHGGLAAVTVTMLYIFFFTDTAIENGHRSLLLLVPSMIEHAVVALVLVIAGVFAFDYFVRKNNEI